MRRACLPCLALALLVAFGSPPAHGGESTPVLIPDFIVSRDVGSRDLGATAGRWLRDRALASSKYRIVQAEMWLPSLGGGSLEITDPPTPAAAAALHDASGADFLAQGRLTAWGGRYAVEVRIYALPSGQQRVAERVMVDTLDDVPAAIGQLGDRIFLRDQLAQPPNLGTTPPEPGHDGADDQDHPDDHRPANGVSEPQGEQPRLWPYDPLDDALVRRLLEKRFPNMAYIPEGPFIMGTDSQEGVNDVEPDPRRRLPPGMRAAMLATERPAHEVLLAGFLIDKFEVSNAEFQRFRLTHTYPAGWDKVPVVGVSWPDAEAYAHSVGKRLPTEAEWERAARGIDGRRFPWGNIWRPDAVAFGAAPQEVGTHPDGQTPEGVFNLAGNVQEWTATLFAPYPGNGIPNRAYDNVHRAVRGSHWLGNQFLARTTARFAAVPGQRGQVMTNMNYQFIGFRCARDVPPLPTLYRWLEEDGLTR